LRYISAQCRYQLHHTAADEHASA